MPQPTTRSIKSVFMQEKRRVTRLVKEEKKVEGKDQVLISRGTGKEEENKEKKGRRVKTSQSILGGKHTNRQHKNRRLRCKREFLQFGGLARGKGNRKRTRQYQMKGKGKCHQSKNK